MNIEKVALENNGPFFFELPKICPSCSILDYRSQVISQIFLVVRKRSKVCVRPEDGYNMSRNMSPI
jgi:hypothetical protein